MKKILLSLVLGYVVLGLIGRAQEAVGLRTCGCDPDCWCKMPGLSIFRWVFPRYHRNHGLEAWKKQQLDR
jgi:hypothetical protein